ncbi:MAG: hypothetical protein WDM90_19760 [Ferruginibacter sp.]
MNKLIIFLIAISFLCCNNSVNNYTLDQDSKDVYNLALENTTGSDTLARYQFLTIAPDFSNISKIKYQKRIDSIKKIMDTATFYVKVWHDIITISSSDSLHIQETVTSNKENLKYEMDGDTSFNEALKQLCNNKLLFDTLDVTLLKSKFNYKIYSDRNPPTYKLREIGEVGFSKIAFTNNKTKAAIYTNFFCGRLCGIGQILFFEKTNGVWKFIRSWTMWAS